MPESPKSEPDSEEALVLRAGQLLGISDRNEVVLMALRDLIQREAGRRLIALGGTMPGLRAPPRRRPPY